MDVLRACVGDGPTETALRALLTRFGGDAASAANAFFDGTADLLSTDGSGAAASGSGGGGGSAVSDDVLATLFKTLDDVGRKLAGLPPHLPTSETTLRHVGTRLGRGGGDARGSPA